MLELPVCRRPLLKGPEEFREATRSVEGEGRMIAITLSPIFAVLRATWNIFLRIGCPMRDTKQGASTSMLYFRKRLTVFWSFPFLVFLSGCDAKPEYDSFETRNAVLQTISDDHNNALAEYAANNSTMAKSSDPSSKTKKSKQQPFYLLGEKIVTTSTGENKRTLKCSGSISVTVGDTKASKEVFTVQQSSDGKLAVSVAPFQF
jgi:hypothetical protein